MKAAVEDARGQGLRQLPTTAREAFITQYRTLLVGGLSANPPARRPKRRVRLPPLLSLHTASKAWCY